MLSRLSSNAVRRAALRTQKFAVLESRRAFVQPSGADRASVVDVPQAYQEDGVFTPRADMLGFKLDMPQREDSLTGKARPIYLDMQVRTLNISLSKGLTPTKQATTPLDPRVLDAMLPYLTDQYGNPHSRTHAYGWEAEKAVDDARKEHKCVLDSCRKLQEEGFDVTYLPVQHNGIIDLGELEASIRPDTSLVSIMTVNNETGVIQPIKEIGALLRKHRGIYFHTDAAQAAGKVPLDVNEMNVDLMSISGHKLYGPKGVGAAYVRRRPRVRLEPIINGGGQERGLRSGTLPAPLVVGLGEAARLGRLDMQRDHAWVSSLADRLIHKITSQVDHVVRNGDVNGYPGCVNLSFAYVEGESLLMALKDVALSSGSACTSASLEPSYVLRALGAAEDMAHSSLRFGMGRFTTVAEVDYVVEKIVATVQRLRDMSPLWEMVQEGIDINTIDWAQH
ncbi:hypothetical protein NLI96_g2457 [Meripilus lineatus]|uniref:cysteine desulfurase n=1 Tax=Meripilus lineatus TaxID=2056292 RepID=A0AAD5V8Q0_9APHY|nr:hypothetical protein NLI96_g2457 [Physisporinus lineatus]